jgi:tRNA(Ile)-lysidine synthetase-like protein
LEEAVPGAMGNLVRFASIAKEDDELLYEMAKELILEEEEGISVAFSDKKPLFRRACLLALKKLGVGKDYTALHLENAYALQFLHRGAKQNFPGGVEATRKENALFFYKTEEKIWTKNEEIPFCEKGFDGGRYEMKCFFSPTEENGEGWKVLRIDRDKIPPTAVFRFRKEGDYITPFGGGTKSLKKFFNEKKVAVDAREYLPLIAEKNGNEVYAVCGVEISERLKVAADTKKTLYITINTKEKSKEKYDDGQKDE